MDRAFTISHTDVHVQSEDQQRPRHGLQLLHEQLVTFVVEYLLILPPRNRMGRSSHDDKTVLPREPRDNAAQSA
jgi:hypothetical protein